MSPISKSFASGFAMPGAPEMKVSQVKKRSMSTIGPWLPALA